MDLFCFSVFFFFFSKNHGFIQEGNPSEKNVIVEEELNGIDADDIADLQDSPRLVFMDEECENLIADGRELTRSINQKKKSGVLQPLYNKCCRREYFFSSHVEYCESVRLV